MEAESKGASSTVYGLIFGVYELLIITMSPVFGKLITKIPPNYLVQAGLLLCGLSTIIFG
jgi:xanthine/uracil permease